MNRSHIVFVVLLGLLAMPASLFAQESNAIYDDDTYDGRLNISYWMDGMGLYCVDAAGNIDTTYKNGGFLLLRDGEEMLYVPAEAIEAGIAEATETGTYATLGVAPEGTWFFPEPAIYYLPASGEFQINIAKSSPDDLREGKLYEFKWTTCEV